MNSSFATRKADALLHFPPVLPAPTADHTLQSKTWPLYLTVAPGPHSYLFDHYHVCSFQELLPLHSPCSAACLCAARLDLPMDPSECRTMMTLDQNPSTSQLPESYMCSKHLSKTIGALHLDSEALRIAFCTLLAMGLSMRVLPMFKYATKPLPKCWLTQSQYS
jgi:hypothetical protein